VKRRSPAPMVFAEAKLDSMDFQEEV